MVEIEFFETKRVQIFCDICCVTGDYQCLFHEFKVGDRYLFWSAEPYNPYMEDKTGRKPEKRMTIELSNERSVSTHADYFLLPVKCIFDIKPVYWVQNKNEYNTRYVEKDPAILALYDQSSVHSGSSF